MLELSPPSRGVVSFGLLNQHLLSQLKRRPTMSEKMHESVSPLRRDASNIPVNRVSSEHRSSVRNSSEDPSISSTHSARHVSSNSRVHPRASNHIHSSSHHSKSRSHDKQGRLHDPKSRSHDHHHKTPKRKRSIDSEEDSAMWTEHISSSGRVYYYNKKEDKSQWEKPKGLVKRPKEDLVSPGNKSLSRPSTNILPAKSSHTYNSNAHSHSHKELVNHQDSHRKSHHEHHTIHKGEGRDREYTSYSQSRRGSDSRGSHSTSPASTKYRSDNTPCRHKYSGRTVTTSPITPKSKPAKVSPTTLSSYSQPTPGDHSSVNRNGDPALTAVGGEQQTPTHLTGRHQLDFTPHMVPNGPTTPDVGSLICSPQSGLMDASGLHPLQKALLLQNQFSQQQPFDPSLCMTPPSALPAHLSYQGSHPSSPLVQSPLSRTPPVVTSPAMQSMTPVQGGVFVMPTSIHGTYNPGMTGQATVPSLQATNVQTVMSRLGYGSIEGYSFPDVSLLKNTPQSFTVDGELVDKSLAESWTRHNDPLQSQIDSCVHDTLQVSLADSVVISGREAVSKLRLETLQITTNTTDVRLSALRSLIDEINSR